MMGLRDLQSHLTHSGVNAVECVDLIKVAHNLKTKKNEQLKLVVDGECCLDRLYGGYFPDWVCGGQWNKMEQFLRNFASVVQASSLDIVVYLNGSLESERLESDWKKKQEETHKFIEEINRHVITKKKPPPKIWWIPPAYLHSAVRLAFRSLQIKTMCSVEDHHKEVVKFCQKSGFQGIVADDPEYLVYDVQRYFSAQKLKLTFKGSLETVEVKLKKLFESLNLPKDRFFIFVSLLEGHLLSESDLSPFYSAIGVDMTAKANLFEKLRDFVGGLSHTEIPKVVELVSKVMTEKEAVPGKDLVDKLTKCLRYYSDVNISKTVATNAKGDKKGKNKSSKKADLKGQKTAAVSSSATQAANLSPEAETETALPSDSQKLEGDSKVFSDVADSEPLANGYVEPEADKKGEATTTKSSLEKLLYRVNPEIENVCSNRHKNGLMSPYIYHVFKHKEIKLPAVIHEAKDSKELPKSRELFRPLRQRIYAILFNLHHLQFLAKQRNEKVPTIQVKETYFCPQTKSIKSEVVEAIEIGWAVPTVERLWLGDKDDCKRKRTRALLTILKSDKPVVLDCNIVPQQYLVMTCVLRYILSSEKRVLRKNEVEAFIAQALIQDMTDPNLAQDIEVTNLSMRGVHLSHLFMEGVEMALFANDACGAPIPFMLFCPWLFFNGKVFNYVLEQQGLGKSLAEICGYKMDLVYSIDQLRHAATEGIKVQYAPSNNPTPFLFSNNAPLMNQIIAPPLSRMPYMPNQFGAPQGTTSLSQLAAAAAAGNRNRLVAHPSSASMNSSHPFSLTGISHPSSSVGLYGNYPGGSLVGSLQGRGAVPLFNDIPGRQRQRIPQRPGSGGQLEVAGMVVGSWGANYGPNNPNYSNQVGPIGRNGRIAFGPAGYALQNMQVTSLLDQMRISGGKGANSRVAAHSAPWNHPRKPVNKIPRKPAGKKADSKAGSLTDGAGKTGNPNKTKSVSFKDNDVQRSEVVDNAVEINGDGENAIDSSLDMGKANEVNAE